MKSQIRISKQINAYRAKVQQRLSLFIESVSGASEALGVVKISKISERKVALTTCIEILSQIRNPGNDKDSHGLILLD